MTGFRFWLFSARRCNASSWLLSMFRCRARFFRRSRTRWGCASGGIRLFSAKKTQLGSSIEFVRSQASYRSYCTGATHDAASHKLTRACGGDSTRLREEGRVTGGESIRNQFPIVGLMGSRMSRRPNDSGSIPFLSPPTEPTTMLWLRKIVPCRRSRLAADVR